MTSSWKIDDEAVAAAFDLLKQASCVLLPTHQNVDADSLSSVLAIKLALQQFNIRAEVLVTDGEVPHSLEFLQDMGEVLLYGIDELPEYDLLLLADHSDRTRGGAFYRDDKSRTDGHIPIINIDHHVTNDRFGVINIIEPTAASTTEVLADVLAMWGTVLTREIAQCLLAGIYGDTLGLRTESTTARTLRTSADLVDNGGNPVPIVNALFRLKSKESVMLWRAALRGVQWTGDLIWTELKQKTFEEVGAQRSEAEGMVNFLVGTEGSRAAAILYETNTGWRVSMRSMTEDVDVARIATHFGGGGHPRAAGVQIEGDESAKVAFLEGVAEMIRPVQDVAEPTYVSEIVLD
ncbi:MAG: bifunctional oligoribonuclease/PAP phosphatase NrnA [Thermomicrobiales bacterium]|nr:bifunctional oligoribonuclease/PAP phosphatase NrnA [Thermomicrobiales bacterium]